MAWLLDADPAVRWQVMWDLLDEPAEVVAATRARVAVEGWGADLLGQQRPDGNWGDDVATSRWRSNLFTLLLLRNLGLDPASAPARRAVALVRDRVTWGPEFGDSPPPAVARGLRLAPGDGASGDPAVAGDGR